ncbi:DNA polymerase epsilon subunit 3 [Canna indica]|uniref:DNA polymerase epsilon subunit 3 n=1 Tax=Canna indica TaxID=4628 RepID=A0AAQ3Q3A5_9LILI|nr:DNA polymerase epsilon subunit 3 [Canna indica]
MARKRKEEEQGGASGSGSKRTRNVKAPEEEEKISREMFLQVMKEKLSSMTALRGEEEEDIQVEDQALLALSECTRFFIQYLYSRADKVSKKDKKDTLEAEHVFEALKEIDYAEFVPDLTTALKEFKNENAANNPGEQATTMEEATIDEKLRQVDLTGKDEKVAGEKDEGIGPAADE